MDLRVTVLRRGTPFGGVEEEGTTDDVDNVTEEQNNINICDIRQGDTTDYSANIKEEPHSPNVENISERNDSIEDSSDDINDMKDEGFSHNMDDIRQNRAWNNIDLREERDSREAHIRESYNCDRIDIKLEPPDDISDSEGEDTRKNMDDIGEHFTWNSTDIRKKGVSQNMDELRENYSSDDNNIKKGGTSHYQDSIGETSPCDNIDIKEEDSDVSMDDSNEDGISYNSDGLEQQEYDAATGAEKTGNVRAQLCKTVARLQVFIYQGSYILKKIKKG